MEPRKDGKEGTEPSYEYIKQQRTLMRQAKMVLRASIDALSEHLVVKVDSIKIEARLHTSVVLVHGTDNISRVFIYGENLTDNKWITTFMQAVDALEEIQLKKITSMRYTHNKRIHLSYTPYENIHIKRRAFNKNVFGTHAPSDLPIYGTGEGSTQ